MTITSGKQVVAANDDDDGIYDVYKQGINFLTRSSSRATSEIFIRIIARALLPRDLIVRAKTPVTETSPENKDVLVRVAVKRCRLTILIAQETTSSGSATQWRRIVEREGDAAPGKFVIYRDLLLTEVVNFPPVGVIKSITLHTSCASFRRMARNWCEAERRITLNPIFGGREHSQRESRCINFNARRRCKRARCKSRFKVPARARRVSQRATG